MVTYNENQMGRLDLLLGKLFLNTNSPFTKVILILYLLSIFSCDGNYRYVQLEGRVYEEATQQPLGGVDIMVTFWVYHIDQPAWESKPVEVTTVTQPDGRFSFKIPKAEAYDLTVSHKSYQDFRTSKTLRRSYNEEVVYLKGF